MKKPNIIDNELKFWNSNQAEVKGKWVVAKPLNDTKEYRNIFERMYHAWLVFRGKAIAVRYSY